MIAKLIVHDTNRERALKKMLRALDELVIDGVPTNIEEQKSILTSKKFMSGQFGTSLYTELFPDKAV
jgi:acetyl-CoA carboxylase biotin carboxylase subunit